MSVSWRDPNSPQSKNAIAVNAKPDYPVPPRDLRQLAGAIKASRGVRNGAG